MNTACDSWEHGILQFVRKIISLIDSVFVNLKEAIVKLKEAMWSENNKNKKRI